MQCEVQRKVALREVQLSSKLLNLAYSYASSGALLETLRSTSALPTSYTVRMYCALCFSGHQALVINNMLFTLVGKISSSAAGPEPASGTDPSLSMSSRYDIECETVGLPCASHVLAMAYCSPTHHTLRSRALRVQYTALQTAPGSRAPLAYDVAHSS